ncbi:MAG: ATP synthase F1 subunit gamma [Deltaproteobacteria bacterium]|nr:ATP synthase F1 subunit gamma [Deltaproteobacteria bacterium]
MANLAAIKKRIKTTKNTQQITKAMKMVAAAKLRGAEERLRAARPYATMLDEVITDLYNHTELSGYELIEGREEVKRREFLVITSDRGLCGGFNSSIVRHVEREILARAHDEFDEQLSFVGRKGHDILKRRDVDIVEKRVWINLLKEFDLDLAIQVGNSLIKAFQDGEFDELYVISNHFVSAISQEIVTRRLIPVEVPKLEPGQVREDLVDYVYEPGREEILKSLLPLQVHYQLYRAFLESFAAEMGARMSAMDAASKNAGEMIDRLTLQYNRSRQAAITVELMEIINGAEALKG